MCHGYKELMSANITIEDNKLYSEIPGGTKFSYMMARAGDWMMSADRW